MMLTYGAHVLGSELKHKTFGYKQQNSFEKSKKTQFGSWWKCLTQVPPVWEGTFKQAEDIIEGLQ